MSGERSAVTPTPQCDDAATRAARLLYAALAASNPAAAGAELMRVELWEAGRLVDVFDLDPRAVSPTAS